MVEKKALLWQVNAGLVGVSVLMLTLVTVVCWRAHSEGNPLIWNLYLIVAAGAGVGNLAGFVFAAYGDENKKFEGLTGLFNGFIGGASITDLARGDQSVLVAWARAMGRGCGIEHGRTLAGLPFVAFAAFGFISMYINRKLLFNPLMAEQDQGEAALQKEFKEVAPAPMKAPGGLGEGGGGVGRFAPNLGLVHHVYAGTGAGATAAGVVQIDTPGLAGNVKSAAAKVAALRFEELSTTEQIVAWSKATLDQGRYEDAIREFAAAIQRRPEDPELHMGYGLALFYSGGDKHAACEELKVAIGKTSGATPRERLRNIYKAMTYCALYLPKPTGFSLAIQYGEQYLADKGNLVDGGILANLVAAYGQKCAYLDKQDQRGSQEFIDARDKALERMKEALRLNPAWAGTFRMLLQPDYPGKDPEENDLEVFWKLRDKGFLQTLHVQA